MVSAGEEMQREIQKLKEESQRDKEESQRKMEEMQLKMEKMEEMQRESEEMLQQEKAKTENTDLFTYLDAVHTYLQKGIKVNQDAETSTKGNITNPTGKLCPTKIRKWEDFTLLQTKMWDRLNECDDSFASQKQFRNLNYLQTVADAKLRGKISSEKDMEIVVRDVLEEPVMLILEKLHENDSMATEFSVDGVLAFRNHMNGVDKGDEMEQRMQDLNGTEMPKASGFPREENASGDSGQHCTKPDQICITENAEGALIPCMVGENKPPHKLSVPILYEGLHEMSPVDDVVNRLSRRDSKAMSELLVAAAITQTFDYMVTSRLQYGYVCTVEAIIFLYFREEDPGTLLYHLSVPGVELTQGTLWQEHNNDSASNLLHETALARLTIFCLQALSAKRLTQSWLNRHRNDLRRWKKDWGSQLSEIPETVRKEKPSSPFKASRKITESDLKNSPRFLRSRKRCAPPVDAKESRLDPADSDGEKDDGDYNNYVTNSPSRVERKKDSNRSVTGRNQKGKQRSYCTQKCLLGLSQQSALDQQCPNVKEHKIHNGGRHNISRQTFLNLMRTQLAEDLDTDVHCWYLSGSRGVMFKVTLSSHGYTVVGKGTVFAWLTDLRHEELVYRHIQNIQGQFVPVCLGGIDLEIPYSYNPGTELVHMMFLAYAGSSLRAPGLPASKAELLTQAAISIGAIHRRGVSQQDVALRNMIWSEELQRVLIIDFERSVVFGPAPGKKQPLANGSPNLKRKRGSKEQQKIYTKEQEIIDTSRYEVVLKNKFDKVFHESESCASYFESEAKTAEEEITKWI